MMRDDGNRFELLQPLTTLTFICSENFHVPSTMLCINPLSRSFPLHLITVINELEGLSRGIKPLTSTGIVVAPHHSSQADSSRIGNRNNPEHAAFVAKASKEALIFLKSKNAATK